MSRTAARAAFEGALTAALADEPLVIVRAPKNDQMPDAPTNRAALRQCFVHIVVSTSMRTADSLGQGAPRTTTGVIMLHVVAATGSGEGFVDRVVGKIVDHLEADITEDLDVHSVSEGPPGERWGGNWWGVSLAVEYQLVS